jgi:hypothetical protein
MKRVIYFVVGLAEVILGLCLFGWVLAVCAIINPQYTGMERFTRFMKNVSSESAWLLVSLGIIGVGAYVVWDSVRKPRNGSSPLT